MRLPGSATECHAGGVVAAVHIGVAIGAGPADRAVARGNIRVRIDRAGVTRVVVALLAQERGPRREQLVVHGTVRVVTLGTIVLHGFVFEQERAALLGVTLVAGLVGRGLDQHVVALGAVRIVAIGAGDLALADRVTRELVHVRLLVLVTIHADPGLRQAIQDLVVTRVHVVAVAAGNIRPAVFAGEEMLLRGLAMAAHAHLGALGGVFLVVTLQGSRDAELLLLVGVLAAGTVTGLAAAGRRRRARIRGHPVGTAHDGHRVLVVVALGADFRALAVAGRRRQRRTIPGARPLTGQSDNENSRQLRQRQNAHSLDSPSSLGGN